MSVDNAKLKELATNLKALSAQLEAMKETMEQIDEACVCRRGPPTAYAAAVIARSAWVNSEILQAALHVDPKAGPLSAHRSYYVKCNNVGGSICWKPALASTYASAAVYVHTAGQAERVCDILTLRQVSPGE